jgi:DNA repair protein RecO
MLLEPYLSMRTDIEKWAYAALFCEIVREMVPEGEPHPDPFILHRETLDRLERDKDPQNVLLLALLRFQFLMGYMPALDGCAICQRTLQTARQWFWQTDQGKLVCDRHFCPNTRYIVLDTGTLALIHYLKRIPIEKIWRLRMRQEMKAPLLRGLLDWFGYHTGKQIQSIKVLDQILPSCGFSGNWPADRKSQVEKGVPSLIIEPDGHVIRPFG